LVEAVEVQSAEDLLLFLRQRGDQDLNAVWVWNRVHLAAVLGRVRSAFFLLVFALLGFDLLLGVDILVKVVWDASENLFLEGGAVAAVALGALGTSHAGIRDLGKLTV
tara:strand:- start:1688 stop:2011 length:324 start_codon:yes stop_codon:yes gene_type:complete